MAPASEYEPSAAGPAYAAGPGQLAEPAYAAGPGQLAEPAYAAGPGQLAEPAYAAGPGQQAETSYQGGSVVPDASVYSDGDALDSYGAPLGILSIITSVLINSFECDPGVTTPPPLSLCLSSFSPLFKDDHLPGLLHKSPEILFI